MHDLTLSSTLDRNWLRLRKAARAAGGEEGLFGLGPYTYTLTCHHDIDITDRNRTFIGYSLQSIAPHPYTHE